MRGIVTLCGSVRFKDVFDKVNRELTLAGYVVLQPGIWEHARLHETYAEEEKNKLDELHLDKINMSDSIVVINVGDYVGRSTMQEIMFAKKRGKSIFWVNTREDSKETSWRKMLK